MSYCPSIWLGGEAGVPFEGGEMGDFDQMEPLTFSVVPAADGRVHAVLDFVIRAAYHDPGLVKLRAACGDEVRPGNRLPLAPEDALCARCRKALPKDAAPRPGPGSPMLHELAQLHVELGR